MFLQTSGGENIGQWSSLSGEWLAPPVQPQNRSLPAYNHYCLQSFTYAQTFFKDFFSSFPTTNMVRMFLQP